MRRAFTLVELLVVIAVIGIVAAVGFGLFRGGDPSVALRSSQATLNALVTATRAQAAVNNRPARLYFYFDPPPAGVGAEISIEQDRFMRAAFIAVLEEGQDPEDPGSNWLRLGDDTYFTDGAFVVPHQGFTLTPYLAEGLAAWECRVSPTNSALTAAPTSRFDRNTPQIAFINGTDIEGLHWIQISPTGRLDTTTGGGRAGTEARRVVLSVGRWTPGVANAGPRLNNPEQIRGIRISTYGIPVLINDPYGLYP